MERELTKKSDNQRAARSGKCLNLLNRDGEIHVTVNGTKQFVCTCCRKWWGCSAIITSEVQANGWGAGLFLRLHLTADPGAIGDDVWNRSIVDQSYTITLFDSDAALDECRTAHVDAGAAGAARCITDRAG